MLTLSRKAREKEKPEARAKVRAKANRKKANAAEENSGSELDYTSDVGRVEVQRDNLTDSINKGISDKHNSEGKKPGKEGR